MKETKTARNTLVATVSLAALLLLCGTAVAQSTQVQGIIDGHQRRHHDRQVSRREYRRRPPFRTPPMCKKLKVVSICGRSRWA